MEESRPQTPLEEAGDYFENYWTKEKLVCSLCAACTPDTLEG